MELSDELYDRIEELSETGNEAMESEDYAKAISCFQEALDILPEPKEDWEAYLWLVGSIGDAHFMMGNYGKSLEFFRKCYNIGETDNPFILLRLGENYLEMEDETNATEFLLRAYMLEGEKIFKEDWKYFQWLVVLSGLVRKAGLRLCLKIFVPHLLFPVFEVSGIGT